MKISDKANLPYETVRPYWDFERKTVELETKVSVTGSNAWSDLPI